jgi:hypothetical protein
MARTRKKLDARILQKTFFTVTGLQIWLCTENKEEFTLAERTSPYSVYGQINVPYGSH